MDCANDKKKPPSWYSLAEKRAYMAAWRAARSGVPLATGNDARPGIHRLWPNAFARGYWDGYAAGPYDGCTLYRYEGKA